jgi:hypothetical protein
MNIIKQAVTLRASSLFRSQLTYKIPLFYSTSKIGPEKKAFNRDASNYSHKSHTNQRVSETLDIKNSTFLRKRERNTSSFVIDEAISKLVEISKSNELNQDGIMDNLLTIKIDQIQREKFPAKNVKSFLSTENAGKILKNQRFLKCLATIYFIPKELRSDVPLQNMAIVNSADLFTLLRIEPNHLFEKIKSEKQLNSEELEFLCLIHILSIKMHVKIQIASDNLSETISVSNPNLYDEVVKSNKDLGINQLIIKLTENLSKRIPQGISSNLFEDIRAYWCILLSQMDITQIIQNKNDVSNFEIVYKYWLTSTSTLNKKLDEKLIYAVSELILRGIVHNNDPISEHYIKLLDNLIETHSKSLENEHKFFNRENFHQKIIEIVSSDDGSDKSAFKITNLLRSISKLSLGTKQFFTELENRLIASEKDLNPSASLNVAVSLVRASSGRKYVKNFLQNISPSRGQYDLKDQSRILFLMSHSNIVYEELINTYQVNFSRYCQESSVDDVIMFLSSLAKCGYKNDKYLNDVYSKIDSSKFSEIHQNKLVPLFWSYNIFKRYNKKFREILEHLMKNYRSLNKEALFQFLEGYFNLEASIRSEFKSHDQELIGYINSQGIQNNVENIRKPKFLDSEKKNFISHLSSLHETKLNVWNSGFFFDLYLPKLKTYIDFDDLFSFKQGTKDYIRNIDWKKRTLESKNEFKYTRLAHSVVCKINTDPSQIGLYVGIKQ